MNLKQHFKEQESKLRLEALLKSALSGIAIGGSVGFIVALVGWFTAIPGLLLAICATIGVSLIDTALFYFFKYKPSTKDQARRLDSMGLDERLITMVEFENDNSYMAKVQRQDAKERLAKIKNSDIRLIISTKLIVAAAICFTIAAAMTTVTGLAEAGIIMGGGELIDSLTPDEPEINLSVVYEAEEGGYIDGEADQLVVKGMDATPVLAVADDGYVFIEWSDGKTDPYRHDLEILEELELFAIFEWDEDAEEEEGDGEGEGEGEGDMEAPADQQGQQQGDGEQSDESQDGDPSDESQTSDQGKYGEANQIIDGETYYREILSEYQDKLVEYLEKNRDKLSEEEIKIIESYIGIV